MTGFALRTPGSPARPRTWTNWAGDQRCTPSAVATPATVGEVAWLVRRAAESGGTVKAIGAGHSFTGIGLTDGVHVHLDHLAGLQAVDRATGWVTFAAGTRLRDVPALLAPYGLAMANLGDIDSQSIAGAISTGTHGTGVAFGGIATQVRALTLVTGGGDVVHCSATEHPDLFHAARVGLGAMGIIVAVTLACVPAFGLHAVERPEPLNEVLAGYHDRIRATDHFEFYWFPHTSTALTKSNTRYAPGAAPARPLSPAARLVDDVLVANTLYSGLCAATNRLPAAIPGVNRMAAQLTGNREFADASHRVFTTRRTVRFREMEYAVPLEVLTEVLAELRAMIDRRRYTVSFPVEVRCAAADDIPLSTANGRKTGYIAIHQYWRTDPFEYFHSAEEIFAEYGGRPHWGKWHFQTSESLGKLYPEFEKFCSVRHSADPAGVFRNDYLDRVLAPQAVD
ncbi:D-arabinono-1,4-lactone oxidase [Specibacter cremeus]|uniref:D-arabinono-1,4-lactone oxidase n=1 Tax=Specibacter cremeus TaxID=1629051 RepID=UPI001F0C1D20|nr:D-arabinono-1,4-lactone oxidase [Specibacter cremeus]